MEGHDLRPAQAGRARPQGGRRGHARMAGFMQRTLHIRGYLVVCDDCVFPDGDYLHELGIFTT